MHELKAMLDAVPALAQQEGWNSNKQWTRAVKSALSSSGSGKGFSICASDCEHARWWEWLYDVTWLRTDGQPGPLRITGCALVAECEWGDEGDVWDDFQKLLLARADCRVMIFEKRNKAGAVEAVSALKDHIPRFSGTTAGDRYLFAVYCLDSKVFHYDEHTVA